MAIRSVPLPVEEHTPSLAKCVERNQQHGRDRSLYPAHCLRRLPVDFFNLTAVIWITQILRQVDLITNQGQTILVFLRITSLLVPILMLVIAPIAIVIAVCYALIKLNGDLNWW